MAQADIGVIGLAVIAAGVMAACAMVSAEDRAAQRDEAAIRQLVSVGMDIDEAANRLKQAGFHVGEKGGLTASQHSNVMWVALRKRPPIIETIRYTMGRGGGTTKLYVVLIADNTGRIREID